MGKLLALLVLVGLGYFLYTRARRQNGQGNDSLPTDSHSQTTSPQASTFNEIEVNAATQDTTQPAADNELTWANEQLQEAMQQYHQASDASLRATALLSAINTCYKQRKNTEYSNYGHQLGSQFSAVTQGANKLISTQEKAFATAYMQLSTLAKDNGDFDFAISLCQQAIELQLADGTATGFEGRIKRIQQAQNKANKA